MRHRTVEFQRRAVLYARLDDRLWEHTRFFAAAASVNAVFAELFAVFPAIRSPPSFTFIREVGFALENANLRYAHEISRCAPGRRPLDHALVCAEQGLTQRYVQARRAQHPCQWESIRAELNRLLNHRYSASVFWRGLKGSGQFFRVLQDVREDLGTPLDFDAQFHRVSIGLKLIEHIRREQQCPRVRMPRNGEPPFEQTSAGA